MNFSRFYWNLKWPPQINFNFLGGRKNSKKLFVQCFFNFNITFLATCEYASDFFKDATKIQNDRQKSSSKFFVGAKTLKLHNHIPHNMEMCRWFFKVLLKFKMAPTEQLKFFWGRKNSQTQLLQSHSPRYWDVHVIFLRFYPNLKWPPSINFIFFCGRKNSKIEVRNNVQVILLKFKMATISRLFIYLWPQKTLT